MSSKWKSRLHQIVFETDTRAGRLFDIVLLWLILASVVVVVFESIPQYNNLYARLFFVLECIFTAIFTFEYLLRISVSRQPAKYVFSQWGIIDFLAVMPFYISFIAVNYHYFLVLRLLRLLRVFRILKLFHFIKEAQLIFAALSASIYRIGVFFFFVLTLVVILGTLMYVVEGGEHGFTSIPQSIYWTVVTITTVGYGDITPHTVLGKWIATFIMLCGYAIIAVPTGIVTAELTRQNNPSQLTCKKCGQPNAAGARFCNFCGTPLAELPKEE